MKPLLHDDPVQFGVHVLLARLGAGGMGVVYLARSPGGRLVAVKAVHAELAADPAFRERFGREVQALRAVGGAFTAPLVDADPAAPRPWLATAYLPGVALGDVVMGPGPLPGPAVDVLGAGLAEALLSIHRAGIAHRDIKPSNVLLTRDGPRLIDLGMAQLPGTATVPGAMPGTPGYLPPEQAAGSEGGPAGDVFSLAAVLVFARTGAGPFEAATIPAVLYRVLHQDPDLSGVDDPALREFLAACLRRNPAERPTAAQVLDFFTARTASAAAHGVAGLPPPVIAWIEDVTRQVPPPGAPAWRSAPPPQAGRRKVLKHALIWSGAAALTAAAGTAGVLVTRGSTTENSIEVWRRTLPKGAHELFPVGSLMLAVGADLGVYALDAGTGERRWHRPDLRMLSSSRVLPAGDVIVVQDLARTYALDSATGAERWQIQSRSSLARLAGDQNVVCLPGVRGSLGSGEFVVGYDTRTGEQRWQRGGSAFHGGVTIVNGVAYLAVKEDRLTGVEAVETATGRSRWRTRIGEPDAYFHVLTPAVAGGMVYVATSDERRGGPGDRLHAFSAADGRPRWTTRLGQSSTWGVTERCLVAGDAVYAVTKEGVIHSFDAATGRRRWRLPTGTTVQRPLPEMLTPVRDLMVVAARRTLLGVGVSDGRVRWRRELGNEPLSPVVAGGLLHVDALQIQSIDPADGRVLRTLSYQDYPSPRSDLHAHRDLLIFSAYPSEVFAVRPR
ncbi:Serine/threonine protein kinase [Thermomonospora echinospora]|uniref:Serine/threonine protein kinase n=1 Tax=Thermomonospora echinospora TaxID=1992 RepID=A0A1H6D677_9ACTN|nr:PQQ-binding-like beta-propeller repeat protein [Thermomonospora echinospora]SEG80782.1 Serine/threonine protein kinase [Thermomonospora echinospora]